MGRVPREQIEKVVELTDIVELIGSYLPLKRAGSNFVAHCPFHDEKTPSFSVSPSRQRFHCFGCGKGGNSIGFLIEYEHLSFIDALKRLAERASVTLEFSGSDYREEKFRQKKKDLIEVNRQAALWFSKNLFDEKLGRKSFDYLKKRGFIEKSLKFWLLGYAPTGNLFLKWAFANGFKENLLLEAGLVAKSERGEVYPFFRDRIMFPICNEFGEVIAFSGRAMNEQAKAKYVNSSETQIFQKNRCFFGLDKSKRQIHKQGFVLICEGQVDLITCFESGFDNVLAPLGTAFTENHAKILKRNTNTVCLVFDGDEAGFKASEKAFAVLSSYDLFVKVVDLKEGYDPDSFIKEFGAHKFGELISQAEDFISYQTNFLSRQFDMGSIEGKSKIISKVLNNIARMKDFLKREEALLSLASRLSLPLDYLQNQLFQEFEKVSKEQAIKENILLKEGKNEQVKMVLGFKNRHIEFLANYALCIAGAREQIRNYDFIDTILENIPEANYLEILLEGDFLAGENSSVESFLLELPKEQQILFGNLLMKNIPGHASKEDKIINIEVIINEILEKLYKNIENIKKGTLKSEIHFASRKNDWPQIDKKQKELFDFTK